VAPLRIAAGTKPLTGLVSSVASGLADLGAPPEAWMLQNSPPAKASLAVIDGAVAIELGEIVIDLSPPSRSEIAGAVIRRSADRNELLGHQVASALRVVESVLTRNRQLSGRSGPTERNCASGRCSRR
jgi:hypothetical protein